MSQNQGLSYSRYRPTIFVVDDDPSDLQLVSTVLGPHYNLLLTDSPDHVVSTCIEKQPDLVLLDVVFPGTSGYQLARLLKAAAGVRNIPVIFLSMKTDEEDIEEGFEAGGVDYVTKPLRRKELLARVKAHINLNLAENRLRQVIDLVPHRLFALDCNGAFILANEAAARFHSRDAQDLKGKSYPNLPSGWKYEVISTETCPGEDWQGSLQVCRERLCKPDGSTQFFRTHKVPFTFSGNPLPSTLEVAIDVTEDVRKREKIETLNRQVVKHSQYKDKLLSLIGHDLSNLVSASYLLLQVLLNNFENFSKGEVRKHLQSMLKNKQNEIHLLTTLLEWSRAQFQGMGCQPERLSLLDEVCKVEDLVKPLLTEKRLSLVIGVKKYQEALADGNMLQSILRNLISNAIKFSREGDTISIGAEERDGRVYISVADEGVGMSKENLERLKEGNPEHMSSLGTRNERGTGLGLSLSKHFIEEHCGELEIDSAMGKGSVFTFSLPAVNV